tara:strand:+ start:397 stop:624 length:228 start_codon:yes stop_codon:yes gene_type:complete
VELVVEVMVHKVELDQVLLQEQLTLAVEAVEVLQVINQVHLKQVVMVVQELLLQERMLLRELSLQHVVHVHLFLL